MRGRHVLGLGLAALAASASGCSREDAPNPLGSVRAALVSTDPVSDAVAASCTTTSVKGLATQLVGEIQCMQPGSMKSIDATDGLVLGDAVFPYLQTAAAEALVRAQKARGTPMTINSALRTLPQQYLLYRWYQTGRCGISLAAAPGKSNHEGAIAVDVDDANGWKPAMTDAEFRWLGASDPVHFDFVGAGTLDLRGLSVTAFQRLWNRNHPEDPIDEDGAYGTETEKRLAQAPVGGFARGPEGCASGDAGTSPTPAPAAGPPEPVPDAPEPASGGDGCSAGARGSGGVTTNALVVALAALVACARRRRTPISEPPATRAR